MLNGLVESLTRKNRHLQKELSESLRANEEQFAQLMKAQAEKVCTHTHTQKHTRACTRTHRGEGG